MVLLLMYGAFAATLAWTGHVLTRRRKYSAVSGTSRAIRMLLGVVLVVVGLWFSNIVAYRMWAAGGPDAAHKETHLSWAYWALAIASVSFLTAGVAWPQGKGKSRA